MADDAARTIAPSPSSTVDPPAGSAASQASQIAKPPGRTYDGEWTVARTCEPFAEFRALSDSWPFVVESGVFNIERGAPGRPGYWHIVDQAADDGSLVLIGGGLAGNRAHIGQQLRAQFEGRLTDNRCILEGKIGARHCTLVLARADR